MNPFRISSRIVPAGTIASGAPPPDPAQLRVPVAVPWCVVHRSEDGVVEVEQRADGPLRAVRFALAGSGLLGLSLPCTVYPGERVRAVLRGGSADRAGTALDAMLVLRWFEPDGTELLWPIAL